MFCKNCGSDATSNMKFCNSCGAELAPPPQEGLYSHQPPPQPMQPPQPQNVAVPPMQPQQPPQPQNVAVQPGPPQMQPQYSPDGQFPPPQKKGSTGLIVTAIAIAMVVIIGGLLLFVFRDSIFGGGTPAPSPTPARGGTVTVNPGNTDPTPTPPPPGNAQLGAELEGSWGNGSGDFIYYFYESTNVRFTLTGNGEGRVHEDEWGEWADWWIDGNGLLHIVGDDTGDHDTFRFTVTGNTLTVIDEDGDLRTYTRSS